MGCRLCPDFISTWWKASRMSAQISTLMSSAVISANFKPLKWLTCCKPRQFWKGMLNFSTRIMNESFAWNILLLAMLKILKSTPQTMVISPWSLILLILILVLFPCSLSSTATSSLIKMIWLSVSRWAYVFSLLPVKLDISPRTSAEINLIAFMCWYTNFYTWISLMLFCRCFLKGIMQSSVMFLWTILFKANNWGFAKLRLMATLQAVEAIPQVFVPSFFPN